MRKRAVLALLLAVALVLGMVFPALGASDTGEVTYSITTRLVNEGVEQEKARWISVYSFDPVHSFEEIVSDSSLRESLKNHGMCAAAGTGILVRASKTPGASQGLSLTFDSLETDIPQEELQVLFERDNENYHFFAFVMPERSVTVTMYVHEKSIIRLHAQPEDPDKGSVVVVPEEPDGYYEETTVLQLSAVPAPGYTFAGWREAEGSTYLNEVQKGSSTVQFTVEGVGAELTAVFTETDAPVVPPVTKELSHGGIAEVLLNGDSEPSRIPEGTRVTVSLGNLDEYYIFHHWEITDTATGLPLILPSAVRNAEASFYMPASPEGVTVRAVLEERRIVAYVITYVDYNWSSVDPKRVEWNLRLNGEPVEEEEFFVRKGDVIDFDLEILDPAYTLEVVRFMDLQGNNGKMLTYFETSGGSFTLDRWPSQLQIYANLQAKPDEPEPSPQPTDDPYPTPPPSAEPVSAPEITAVELLGASGVLASGVLTGDAWTLTLPADTDPAILAKLREQYLRISYTGVSVAMEGGVDDAIYEDPEMKWSGGGLMCNMVLDRAYTFTVRGADGSERAYTVTIKLASAGEPSPAPETPKLSALSLRRTAADSAELSFTASVEGSCVYALGNAEFPAQGEPVSAGENVLRINGLGSRAQVLHLLLRSGSGAESEVETLDLPAWEFKISTSYNSGGGSLILSRSKAAVGETIFVTVTPASGYRMVSGSLCYTEDRVGAAPASIYDGCFDMPESDVTVSCQWEKSSSSTSSSGGILAFMIGSSVGVINDSLNAITVAVPYGTDLTKLVPTVYTNGVVDIWPRVGSKVDFSETVTYYVELEDGTEREYTVIVYTEAQPVSETLWGEVGSYTGGENWWEYAKRKYGSADYPIYWD